MHQNMHAVAEVDYPTTALNYAGKKLNNIDPYLGLGFFLLVKVCP